MSAFGIFILLLVLFLVFSSHKTVVYHGEVTFISNENDLLFTLYFSKGTSNTYIMQKHEKLTFMFNPGKSTFQYKSTKTQDEGTIMVDIRANDRFEISLPIEDKQINTIPMKVLSR